MGLLPSGLKRDPTQQRRPKMSAFQRPRNVSKHSASRKILPLLRSSRQNGTMWLLAAFILIGARPAHTTGIPLNEFISHYEPAYFSLDPFAQSYSVRTKRENNDRDLAFNFTAHNRLFQVILQNGAQEIFDDDVEFENDLGPIFYPTDNVYTGSLKDLPDSSVKGVVTFDGHFEGHISTPSEMYYIEPAHRYLSRESADFHSVIYKASDVVVPLDKIDPQCKSHELHLRRKEEQQSKSSPQMSFTSGASFVRKKRDSPKPKTNVAIDWTVKEASTASKQTATKFGEHMEAKIAARRGFVDQKKKTCMLYLQADHLFYEAMGSEEACIESMTRHVQRINSIYKPIDFDQDGQPDNISFMIKRIKVHTSNALNDTTYRFPGNYGVEKFLEIFSEENYDAFCLAYMFTYRDFEGGTLGLAWTGDLKNAGGVCERNGHYRGNLKSLNTGIITLLNYGKQVPPAVSHVTMAHEMGHNFGSPHDPENNKACVPGGEDGNYIMFARATSGDKRNNRNFSPCSLKSIKPVLNGKGRGFKGCFQEPKTALCGNGIVEEGEECDCGWEEDCEEDCCWPQRTVHSKAEQPCTLKAQKECSPSQGPCCSNTCVFKLGQQCRDDNGCRDDSFCDGTIATCPESTVKPNKTVCNKEFVCYKGECTGSICLAYGLESCQCSQGQEDPPTKACELCCKEPGDNKPCLSSFELNEMPWDIPDMFSKPGTPCNNYQGYCDVFQKCREVDPSGPLATLRQLLLSERSIASFKKFLMKYWYTVIFFMVTILMLMAIIVKFCGKKTPLVTRHKKRRRTIHHDGDPTSRNDVVGPSNSEDVQVHPATIENVVPYGKKVRRGEKKSSSNGRSKEVANDDDPVENSIAKAVKLAANLGSHLALNFPGEGVTTNTGRKQLRPDAERRDLKLKKMHRKQPQSHFKKRQLDKRCRNALSHEKISNTVTSLSKSFEKLDAIGAYAKKAGERRRKRKLSRSKTKEVAEDTGNEVTIAKLGRFRFSLEVKPPSHDTTTATSGHRSRSKEPRRKIKHRSSSSGENVKRKTATGKSSEDSNQTQKTRHSHNYEKASHHPKVFKPPSVIVSKRRQRDRPRREPPVEKSANPTSLDYRLSFTKSSSNGSTMLPEPNVESDSRGHKLAAASKSLQSLKNSETGSRKKLRSDDGRKRSSPSTESTNESRESSSAEGDSRVKNNNGSATTDDEEVVSRAKISEAASKSSSNMSSSVPTSSTDSLPTASKTAGVSSDQDSLSVEVPRQQSDAKNGEDNLDTVSILTDGMN